MNLYKADAGKAWRYIKHLHQNAVPAHGFSAGEPLENDSDSDDELWCDDVTSNLFKSHVRLPYTNQYLAKA